MPELILVGGRYIRLVWSWLGYLLSKETVNIVTKEVSNRLARSDDNAYNLL
jgi:hypothetical protein